MKLAHIADDIAADIYTRPIHPTRSQASVILDACDTATGGGLRASTLDRLVDMVERRLTLLRPWTPSVQERLKETQEP